MFREVWKVVETKAGETRIAEAKREREKRRRKSRRRRRKNKRYKKKRTMEVKKIAEEWEILDEEDKVAKLEEEAKNFVLKRFYK